jgi:hypothetical protein
VGSGCRALDRTLPLERRLKQLKISSIIVEDCPFRNLLVEVQQQNPSASVGFMKIVFSPEEISNRKITFSLENISLYKLLIFSTGMTNSRLKITDDRLIVCEASQKAISKNQILITSEFKWKINAKSFYKLLDLCEYLQKNKSEEYVLKSELKISRKEIDRILRQFREHNIKIKEFWVPTSFHPGMVDVLSLK